MSLFAAAPMASDWPSFRLGPRPGGEQEDIGLGLGYGRIQTSTVESRPPLRSHKSFPHTLGTSNYATPHCGSPLSQVANPGSEQDTSAATSNSEEQKSKPVPAELSVQTTFGGSAPASPVPQLTPTSVEADHDDQLVEDDEDAVMAEESGTGAEGENKAPVEKTAAERRAEKRKMKRFRLTHNQTRFLMSEFARQAHPDAAQRERLSREIPGLSPRQVQVWFQNRRAKLKRLTTDDRERMMKSRALPEDFDMTQALHSPFGNNIPQPFSSQAYSTPLASPASYASTYDTGMIRPLIVNGLRRESEDDSTISPVSISSAFGSFYTPPGSVPTSENMSPVSPNSERAPFMNTSYTQSSPRNSNPFSTRSSSFSSNFHGHPQIPRLQLHDRVNRSRAESLASPLRTSMSYTGNLDYASPSTEEHMSSSQPGSLGQPARSFSIGEPSVPQSAGFNFSQGFQSSALARPRPTITTFPPGLDLGRSQSAYRPLLPFSAFQNQHHTSSHTQPHNSLSSPSHFSNSSHLPHHQQPPTTSHSSMTYASAPLAPPQDFQLPNTHDLYSYNEHHDDNLSSLSNVSGHTSHHDGQQNPLEPESYYKSEPESRRHMSMSRGSHFSPLMGPQSGGQPGTPQTAGVKRRRDSGGQEAEPDLEGFGSARRRSFTLPSGYGT